MKRNIYTTFLCLFAVVVMSSCEVFLSDDTTYTLTTTASPAVGGTITPSEGEFEKGEQITLRAEPYEKWRFERWEGDMDLTANPLNYRMYDHLMVIGIFVKREYPLNITIEGEGTVQEEVVEQKLADYEHGTIVRLTAEPAEGWAFVEWTGDLDSEQNTVEILIDQEFNITAHFSSLRDTETIIVEVTNPVTDRIWMDRNLGASRAARSSTDAQAYGDLYQWGRPADDHQHRNSPTTSNLSGTDQPGHGSFILAPDGPWDWRNPQNDNLWWGVNGINNPCPVGYRLPTDAEWEAERQSWSSNDAVGAFASPLKLPMAGNRSRSNGSLYVVGSRGSYWSSTVSDINARDLRFSSSTAWMGSDRRAVGYSVRCLKD